MLAIASCSRSITEAMDDAAMYNICLLSPWGSKRKKRCSINRLDSRG